jgi:hypothetical protein
MSNILEYRPTPRRSILGTLRRKYPDQKWTAYRSGFGSWSYETEEGWVAHWCAALAPRFDGDDDNFVSEFWVYPKGATPERLWV